AELIERERKRIAREKKLQWLEEQRLKERWMQEIITSGVLRKKKRKREQQRQALQLKPPNQLVA
ncbi:MAG: hypothetical protein J7497_14260, partial [Chitinophagaceae bacterium]|nr:hypothetical protein [Chitinophagaceae bacterium]